MKDRKSGLWMCFQCNHYHYLEHGCEICECGKDTNPRKDLTFQAPPDLEVQWTPFSSRIALGSCIVCGKLTAMRVLLADKYVRCHDSCIEQLFRAHPDQFSLQCERCGSSMEYLEHKRYYRCTNSSCMLDMALDGTWLGWKEE